MVWQITDTFNRDIPGHLGHPGSPEDLLERYAAGERNFPGIELIDFYRPSKYTPKYGGGGIDIDGVVLRDINLRGAVLQEADLNGADLGGIFLRDCRLGRAIIRDANLCAANLQGSGFIDADLRGSNLNYMNANCAEFRGAYIGSFEQAILAQTNFEGSHTSSGLICRGLNLIWNTTIWSLD